MPKKKNQTVCQKMPPRNHCRDALVQHCLEFARGDKERAVKTLDRIVREQLDFLVPWACLPKTGTKTMSIRKYIDSRFNAETWVDTHVKLQKMNYKALLADAYLHTPGLELPDDMWDDEEFVQAFRHVALLLLSLKVPPRTHNLIRARQHRVAGPIVIELEATYPSEIVRLLQLYDALLENLHMQGVPPYEVIERLVGEEEARRCSELIENKCNFDLDIDAALQAGWRRQHNQYEHKWDTVSCKRAVSLLEIINQNKTKISIGEDYDFYRKTQTLRHHEQNEYRIKAAKELGVWRIRRSEINEWKSALTEQEWHEYQQCELFMSTTLPTGVYSEIPRRYLNNNSLQHMREHNLSALRATFLN